jgi:hypothetical protein
MLNTTLIDHEAGQDPILGQPTETQDQIDKRYRTTWGETVLPSDQCLATFIERQVASWQALLGHNETDRVFVMKMVDKMFTANENTIDAIEDYCNAINKTIDDYDKTANTGSDIDRNKLDKKQEQKQQLRHQFKFGRYILTYAMPVIREKILVETNLQSSWHPRINRAHTKRSRKSVRTYSPESEIGQMILKTMNYIKTNNKAYIPRTQGIDDPSSSNDVPYDRPADYEIDTTNTVDKITVED